MKKIKCIASILLFLSLIFNPLLNSSFAEDTCADVLQQGIYDTEITDISFKNIEYRFFWLCSQEYSDTNSRHNAGIEAVYKSVPISANFSRDSYNHWKSQYCTTDIKQSYISSKEFILKKMVNDNIIDKWAECMTLKNDFNFLNLSIDDNGNNEYTFTYVYRSINNNKLKILGIEQNRLELHSGTKLPKMIASNDKPKTLHLKRLDPLKPAYFKLYGTDDLKNSIEAEVLLPPEQKFDLEKMDLYRLFFIDKKWHEFSSHNERDPQCTHFCRGRWKPKDLRITENSYHCTFDVEFGHCFRAGACGTVDFYPHPVVVTFSAPINIDKNTRRVTLGQITHTPTVLEEGVYDAILPHIEKARNAPLLYPEK